MLTRRTAKTRMKQTKSPSRSSNTPRQRLLIFTIRVSSTWMGKKRFCRATQRETFFMRTHAHILGKIKQRYIKYIDTRNICCMCTTFLITKYYSSHSALFTRSSLSSRVYSYPFNLFPFINLIGRSSKRDAIIKSYTSQVEIYERRETVFRTCRPIINDKQGNNACT